MDIPHMRNARYNQKATGFPARWIIQDLIENFGVTMRMREKSAVTEYHSYCRSRFAKKNKKMRGQGVPAITVQKTEDLYAPFRFLISRQRSSAILGGNSRVWISHVPW